MHHSHPSLSLWVCPDNNVTRWIIHGSEKVDYHGIRVAQAKVHQHKRSWRPPTNHLFQVRPSRVFRLVCLGLVLVVEEAALGNDNGDPLAQPRRVGGERCRCRVAQERKHGRCLRCRDGLAGLAPGLDLLAGQGRELGPELLDGVAEDVADAGHRMVAVKDGGRHALDAPQRHNIAMPHAVGEVGVEKGSLGLGPAVLGAPRQRLIINRIAMFLRVLGANETPQIQHRISQDKVIKRRLHTGGTINVRRVLALDKGGRQQRVVVVAMGEEDVLGPQLVDAEPGVEQQVERRNDKGRVPGGSTSARQDVLMVRLGEAPLEDI